MGWGNEIYEIDEEWVSQRYKKMKLNGKIENLEIKELHFTVFGIFSKNVQNRDITKKKILEKMKNL